jgi:hypothetical protein
MSYKLLRKMVESELSLILTGKEQRFSYLVEGPHGIGKSAFWKEVCLEYNGYFVDLRLGQRDLGDIIGMPTILVDADGTKHMVHVKPELVRKMFVKSLDELGTMGDENDPLGKDRAEDRKGHKYDFILSFLDEYNRGTKDVQQAVFELVYDRRMNGDKVHPKTLIAAACNDNLEVYTITEGDPAFRSRFKTIKYTPTVEEWLNWGRRTGELCEEVIFMIESKKDLADPPKSSDLDKLNQPHPNRRSWHEASKFFSEFKTNFNEIEMRDVIATFVGGEAAEIFRLMIGKMAKTTTAAPKAANVEAKKVEQFYNQFIRLHKWSPEVAKKELANFNPSEMQSLTDHCIAQFDMFNYMTGVTKDRVESLSELIPNELFAKIWHGVNNANGLRDKMLAHVAAKGKPDYFNKFKKS